MSDTRNYANCMGNEGGTPIYLEDKRLSESASQSTLASTDAIMLKGTDGTYHEIARDSLVEAVRSVMGGILKNLDKGTTIGALAALGSGDDLGSITPANLASVLGVPLGKTAGSNFDANQVFSDGITMYSSTGDTALVNGPSGGSKYWRLINFKFGQTTLQLFFDANVMSSNDLYYRIDWSGNRIGWKIFARQ